MESLSYDTKNAIDFMEKRTKVRVNKIISSGGSVQNIEWMKIRSNIFNKNIYIDKNYENVSFGSALLAGIGIGLFKNEDEGLKNFKNSFKIIKKNKNKIKLYKTLLKKYNININKIIKINQNIVL